MAIKTKKIVGTAVHVLLMTMIVTVSWLLANLYKSHDKNVSLLEQISKKTYADTPHTGGPGGGTGGTGTTGGSGTCDGTGGGGGGGGK